MIWKPELPLLPRHIFEELTVGADPGKVERMRTIMDHGHSWFNLEITADGSFRSGCDLCKQIQKVEYRFCAALQGRLGNFRQHASSKGHRKCLEAMFGLEPAPTTAAPSANSVLQVLVHIQQGNAGSTLDGVAARHRILRMESVLVEAQRRSWRAALQDSISIALLRDERHKRCLVLFRTCNAELEVVEGIIGQAKLDYSSSALGLGAATLRIINDFCTPLKGAPDLKQEQPCDK